MSIEWLSSGMPSVKGGCPRPSFRWQFWQARELNRGPSPSEASVEAGAETQFLRKMALPILKSSSRLKSILPEEAEKALAVSHACLRGGTAAGLVLALLDLGEIRGRRGEAWDARIGARAIALQRAEDAAAGSRQARSARRASAYATGLASAMLATLSSDNATAVLGTVSVQSAYVRT